MTKIKKFSIAIINNVQTLRINDQIALCPYRNPVLMPHGTIQGQIQIQTPVCNANCQFFNIRKTSDYTGITNPIEVLTTECNKTTFNVTFEQSEPDTPKSNLTSL